MIVMCDRDDGHGHDDRDHDRDHGDDVLTMFLRIYTIVF